VPQVLLIAEVEEGLLLVLRGPLQRGSALLQRPGTRGFSPVRAASMASLTPLLDAWPAPNAALLRVGSSLRLLDGGGDGTGELQHVLTLPQGARSVAATWLEEMGLTIIALVDVSARPAAATAASAAALATAASSGDTPVIWPTAPASLELRRYTASAGWVKICTLPHAACGLAISATGDRAGWCVRETEDEEATGVGEFHVAELKPTAKPKPLTEGAGLCGPVLVAPDGSGVVYLANHIVDGPSDGADELALWWAPFEGGMPPLQLSPPRAAILDFGWAPAVEEEVEVERGEDDGEEDDDQPPETELVLALRLWVTLLRNDRAHTTLLDLHGTILGAFELPVSGAAVTWLQDGRRVLVTESESWFPSLWDGAALLALPLPSGFGQIGISLEEWSTPEGHKSSGVVYSMRGTPPTAPIIVVFQPPAEGALLAVRSSAAAPPLPLHALLRCGFRVFKTRGHSPDGAEIATAMGESVGMRDMIAISEALAGVDDYLASLGRPTGVASVGVLGAGFGGHLAVQALACSDRFVAGASVGGFVDDAWRRLETGNVRPGSAAPLVQGDTLEHLDAISAPLLMLHGADDKVSPPSHARVVYHHLHARKVPVQLVVYPAEGHRLSERHSRRDAAARLCEWFLTHLPGAKPPPLLS